MIFAGSGRIPLFLRNRLLLVIQYFTSSLQIHNDVCLLINVLTRVIKLSISRDWYSKGY